MMAIKNQLFRVQSCKVACYGCPNKGKKHLGKSIVKEKVDAHCEKDFGKSTESKVAAWIKKITKCRIEKAEKAVTQQ